MNNGLEVEVFEDKFLNETHVVLNPEQPNVPRIYVYRECNICNVDILMLEYHNPSDVNIYAEFSHYVIHFKEFLNQMYSKINKGYVLYRRKNGAFRGYLENIEDDIIFEVFASKHHLVLPGKGLFPYLNHNDVEWCLYSKFIVENTFNLIKSNMDSINGDEYLVEPHLENLQLINAEYSLKGVNITFEERVYNLSFHLSDKEEMTLHIVGKPSSIPIRIPLTECKLNWHEHIHSIETANRFIRLFE